MKIKDLIERLGREDPEVDVYFGEWSGAHDRVHFTDIKLKLEEIRRDSSGKPYPPVLTAFAKTSQPDSTVEFERGLIIRKDFQHGKNA